ncbi:winged helix-turn-helix domain-containing protein [Pseudoroseomonas wenyumeiae]
MSSWRILDLCRMAEERFVTYGESGMLRLVKSLDLSWQKTRPSHPKADRAAQEDSKGGLAAALKGIAQAHPEADVQLWCQDGWKHCFQPRGPGAAVPASGTSAASARAAPSTSAMRPPGSSARSALVPIRPLPSCSRRSARRPCRPSSTALRYGRLLVAHAGLAARFAPIMARASRSNSGLAAMSAINCGARMGVLP